MRKEYCIVLYIYFTESKLQIMTKLRQFNNTSKANMNQVLSQMSLYIDICSGEISSLITRAAPRLTYLELSDIDMDTTD